MQQSSMYRDLRHLIPSTLSSELRDNLMAITIIIPQFCGLDTCSF
jgi:hypothetical protein